MRKKLKNFLMDSINFFQYIDKCINKYSCWYLAPNNCRYWYQWFCINYLWVAKMNWSTFIFILGTFIFFVWVNRDYHALKTLTSPFVDNHNFCSFNFDRIILVSIMIIFWMRTKIAHKIISVTRIFYYSQSGSHFRWQPIIYVAFAG